MPGTHLTARQALHLVTKLSLEIVHHNAVVPSLVPRPLVCARKLLWHPLELVLAFGRELLKLGFYNNSVEVFVQPIEQKDQKLLRVVLL
jgi:hypothetical protein